MYLQGSQHAPMAVRRAIVDTILQSDSLDLEARDIWGQSAGMTALKLYDFAAPGEEHVAIGILEQLLVRNTQCRRQSHASRLICKDRQALDTQQREKS